MSNERLMKIILAPCVSEKSTMVQVDRQYVFQVKNDATKPEIARAVKLAFGVDVEAVRVINVKGKAKRFGAIQGRKKAWKKAFITLKEGQAINLSGGV